MQLKQQVTIEAILGIVDGIKFKLQQLRSWSIEHVKRDANTIAHTIAKEAISCVIDRVWVEEIPTCIFGIISMEVLPLGY
jgi:hypothetical protein